MQSTIQGAEVLKKYPFPLSAQPLSQHTLSSPTKGWAGVEEGPLPTLPGATVCRAETTSHQRCTEMWHSAPRSPRHFGAAESEVLFLKEKPKST